jgi:hypothetical protein
MTTETHSALSLVQPDVDGAIAAAERAWDKMVADEWYLLDAPYAEIGDPNGPPEDYHILTLMPSDELTDHTVSLAYFADGIYCFSSKKPEVPLMRSWNAQPIHQTFSQFIEKYPEWSSFFLGAIDWDFGANSQVRAYRRMEQWGIDIHDEIGKQRILKDVEDAHARLFRGNSIT